MEIPSKNFEPLKVSHDYFSTYPEEEFLKDWRADKKNLEFEERYERNVIDYKKLHQHYTDRVTDIKDRIQSSKGKFARKVKAISRLKRYIKEVTQTQEDLSMLEDELFSIQAKTNNQLVSIEAKINHSRELLAKKQYDFYRDGVVRRLREDPKRDG